MVEETEQKRNSDIIFGKEMKSNLRKNIAKDKKFYVR